MATTKPAKTGTGTRTTTTSRTLLRLGLFACALGVLATRWKHLALRIPNVGFVVFALLGGDVPPYFDHAIWARHEEWLQPNDVVVIAPAKSGTTWTMHTVGMIRRRGDISPDDDPARLDEERVPWAEFAAYPGQSLDERVRDLRAARRVNGYRVFKTHSGPTDGVPVTTRRDVKFVVVLRSLEDATASFESFIAKHHPAFVKMWGGFPVPHTSREQYMHWLLKDIGDGRASALEHMWMRIADTTWGLRRGHPNVEVLHYTDGLRDPRTTISRLAKLMGVQLSPAELAKVVERTSFEWMRKNERDFLLCRSMVKAIERGFMPPDTCLLLPGAMLQKGRERNAVETFGEEGVAAIRAAARARLAPDLAEWLERGSS